MARRSAHSYPCRQGKEARERLLIDWDHANWNLPAKQHVQVSAHAPYYACMQNQPGKVTDSQVAVAPSRLTIQVMPAKVV